MDDNAKDTSNELEQKITLTLDSAGMQAQIAKRLQAAQKRAKIQGFRPGKAPMKMVEGMYGASVREEVLNEAVQKAFYDKVSAENIALAGYPAFNLVDSQNPDEFTVEAVFETYPKVKLGDYAAQNIDQISAEVGDAEIDKTIDILRQQRTSYHHVERAAQENDRVIIDFTGTIDGEPFNGNSAANYPFVLGKGQMLPEFEAGVVGMKEGETKDVTVAFPEDYHGKDVAGKTAVFAIKLNNVSEPRLPEVDAEFAKTLGVEDGDISKMRAEVHKNVSREVKRRVDEQTKENVMNALLESTSLQVPRALVTQESERLRDNAQQNFVSQGFDPKQLPEMPANLFEEEATRRVKLGLILSQLVEEHKLDATDEQVRAVVEDFADSYEDPKEVIDWYMSDKKNLQGPTSLAVEANVVAHVLSRAKVNPVSRSFDEVMNPN